MKNDVEKRELFEQERKIFEAGTQRVDRRTGSFSFLTWPFFIAIAPFLASEGFFAATFNSASAEEGGANAAQAGAALQAAYDDPPADDPSKPGAGHWTAEGPVAASDAHAAPLDPTVLLGQPHEDAPKPGTAPDHDVASAIAPVAAAQPELTTATDTVSTLSQDVPGTIAPLDAAAPTILADGTDAAAPMAGQALPLDVPVSTVAAMDHQLDDPSAALDMAAALTDPAVAGAVPVLNAAEPLLAVMTGAAGQPTTLLPAAASDDTGAHTLVSSAPVLDVADPVLATVGDSAQEGQEGNMASHALANAAPAVDAIEPALATTAGASLPNVAPAVDAPQPVIATTAAAPSLSGGDVSYPADLADTGNGAGHILPIAGPDTGQAPGPADTLLAFAMAADAPIESPGSATAAQAEAATDAPSAAAAVHPTAIAADVIALNDAPPPPANALFTGSQYTHYGVALSSDVAASPQHAASAADAASAHDTSVPAVADVQKHAPPPPDIVDTTHPMDHLGHAIL
jgi:hypothetical protein